MRRGTNLPAVGSFNQTVILDLIRRSADGISRADVATATGLSPQTISNATRRLLDEGLVVEAGTQVQGRGKPPVILQLSASSRFAVGVHLDPAVVTYVVADLSGKVVAHAHSRTPPPGDPTEAVAEIARGVRAIIRDAGVPADTVLGVGIASPGPIDAERGVVVDPPLLEGWRDVPLREELAAATKLPVLLEKDVNAAAVAEIWIGGPDEHRDFAFFYLGTGIGIGLALGGEVLRGATGNAGEGGTLVVPSDSLPAERRSSMLGHLATPQFLVEQAIREGLLEPDAAVDVSAGLERLTAAAHGGDAAAKTLFARAGTWIGTAIVTIVNLLDVGEVVFGGPAWLTVAPFVLPSIDEVVRTSPDRVTRHPVILTSSLMGDDVTALGAACLVLDTTLSPRPSALLIAP